VADGDPDSIRLTLPADVAVRPVVEVATGVLARRVGLSDDEVTSARSDTGAAFGDLARHGGDEPVVVEIHTADRSLDVAVTHAGGERHVHAPRR
jgi:hypothetical protein